MKNKKSNKIQSVKEINIYISLTLLVLVPLLLNWKIINYDFTKLDDSTIITNNFGFLSDFKNATKAFEKDNFLSKEGKGYYRPIQTITFMIDAHIGGEKPEVYHFFNLLYHILTVMSLFLLLRLCGIKNNLSFFLSLLFSIHPLFTDAIAWIAGRGDILAGLFGTLSFISFIKYNNTRNKIFYLYHCATFALAIFSKEISIALPAIIIFYHWFINNNKYKIRELLPFMTFWIITIISFFFLRNRFLNPQDILSFESFIKNLPIIPILMAKMLLPFGLSPMPVFTAFYTAAGVILIISVTAYIIKFKSLNKNILVLGIIWFIAFIVPMMFVRIPLGRYQFEYLECRSYLPSIGIFLALGVLLNEKIRKKEIQILLRFFIPVIFLFSILTYIYSEVFAGPDEFYSSVINSDPENAYALCSRGCLYSINGKVDAALADFDNSIKAIPIYSEAYYDKGALYNSMGNHQTAEKFYKEALNYDTLYPNINNLHEYAFINLSSEKLSLRKYNEVVELLNKADMKYPGNCSIHNNLGLAYYSMGNYNFALDQYNQAIEADKTIYSYYNNRGMANYQIKNFTSALNDFNEALKINPGFQDAWTNRGITKVGLNDYSGAINDLTESINLNPNNGIAWYFRGIAYSKLNKNTEAEQNLQKALKLGFKMINNK
jgi:tetratricopeptide (TPR) repeat protein